MHNHQGFTLIEIMAALAVLAVSLVVLLGLRNRDLLLTANARAVTDISMLAQRKMTEISTDIPDVGLREGDFGEDAPGFRWEAQIDETEFETLRVLSLRILWGEGQRRQSESFTTYLFIKNDA